MNQEKVKSILLEIEKPALEFSLIFSGKASKKVNGLYKPDTHEIILHNQNFKTDNQLMYTAIHEYAHHLITEEHENSALPKKTTRPHTNEFWARFHGLLEVAEEKGFYVLGVDASPELLAITENIKKNYLEKIGILQKELGKHLSQAQELCIASNVRYEDYLERCLQISKKEARSARKISALDITPSIGYENMKMLAAIPSPEKRTEAQQQLRAGKSADSVRSIMKKKAEDVDETVILEKEKTRLEKTITKLSNRLEEIKDIIMNGFSTVKPKQAAMNDKISSSMCADDIEKAKKKIHKLLALSKSANEHEAALAIEKCNAIMQKLNISSIEEASIVYKNVKATKSYHEWRLVLARAISELYCTRLVNMIYTNEIKFYGTDLDVFMSCETYSYLQKSIQRMARLNVRKNAKTPFRESYKLGIAYGLRQRFYNDPNIAWHSAERKTKRELAVNYCNKRFELSKYPDRKTNSTAFGKGCRDSENINLNRQVAEEKLSIGGY